MPTVTSAQAMHLPLMALRNALALRGSNPGSPYQADEIERLLSRAGLTYRYPLVVEGLRHGFRVGFPIVPVTQVPQNNPSVTEFHSHFHAVMGNEISKGRYIGPASRQDMEALLGPFQCSPLSIIPKSTPGKFRIIQNFSYPHIPDSAFPLPSVNSHTDPSAFPCIWGTFASVAHLVWHLPPGSQMAVRDVAEAYRTIPLHCLQWAATVVGLGVELFCADIFAAFGARPSGGVFGMVADALVDLMRWKGLGPVTKWVDDHVFFHIRQRYISAFNTLREKWRRAVERNGGLYKQRGRLWFEGEQLGDGSRAELFEDCAFPLGGGAGMVGGEVGNGEGEGEGFSYGFSEIDAFSREVGIVWEESKCREGRHLGADNGGRWKQQRRAEGRSEQSDQTR